MMTHAAHKAWLKVSAIVIGFFGPALTLATMPGLREPARLGLDILAWPVDGFPSYEAPEIWFLSALTGGFLVGWAITLWCLSLWVYDAAPEGVRKCVVWGTCSWFVFDSFGSVMSGHPANVLFNVLVLLMVIGPMWRPARAG